MSTIETEAAPSGAAAGKLRSRQSARQSNTPTGQPHPCNSIMHQGEISAGASTHQILRWFSGLLKGCCAMRIVAVFAVSFTLLLGTSQAESNYPMSERMVRECGIKTMSNMIRYIGNEAGAECMGRFMSDQMMILEILAAMGENQSLLEDSSIQACASSLGFLFGFAGVDAGQEQVMGAIMFCVAAKLGGAK